MVRSYMSQQILNSGQQLIVLLSVTYFDVLSLIGTFVGGAFGAKLLEYAMKNRSGMREKRIVGNLQKLSDVYQELETITNTTDVERAIIWKGHDSGFIPQPGMPYYVSAMHWNTKLKTNPEDSEYIGYKYRNIQVDGPYLAMILEIIKEKKITSDIQGMPDSILKNLYLAVEVKYVETHFIHSTEKDLFYISLSTTKPDEKFTNHRTRNQVDLSVGKIRQCFGEFV